MIDRKIIDPGEKTVSDAPAAYGLFSASSWVQGWNACRAAVLALQEPEPRETFWEQHFLPGHRYWDSEDGSYTICECGARIDKRGK